MASGARRRRPRTTTTDDLRRIASDRTHSASWLADRALRVLSRHLARGVKIDPKELRRLARALRNAQPAMGAFARFSSELDALSRSAPSASLASRVRVWIQARTRELRTEDTAIAHLVRARFPPGARVVTISRSRTVARALGAPPLGRRARRAVALRSRPGGEGVGMARDLRARRIPTSVVDDEAYAAALDSADLVVIGADALLDDGSILHKVGTRRLARAARERGVPVVVIAGLSKRVNRGRWPVQLPANFDRTPAAWISEYWTNDGVYRFERGRLRRR
jgi:translation initiation factor 2B subunit (eIF-2B alpha/beta/delta family)